MGSSRINKHDGLDWPIDSDGSSVCQAMPMGVRCNRPKHVRNVCVSHYNQTISGKTLTVLRDRIPPGTTCSLEFCDERMKTRGYCARHYSEWHRGRAFTRERVRYNWRPRGKLFERNEHGQKQCKDCERWLDEDRYAKHPSADGLAPRCVDCVRCKTHNISFADYMILWEEQRGLCAACGTKLSAGVYHVDHDHACCSGVSSCGKCVRGILCRSCNQTLGFAKDSLVRLRGLSNYIEKWSKSVQS